MIALIVPSRGRPARARDMWRSAYDMAEGPVRVIVAVDPDDPFLDAYGRMIPAGDLVVLPERLGYSGSINHIAAGLWDDHDIIGAFGDDVIFRTKRWDTVVTGALTVPGMVYPNDMAHKESFATAVFMSSTIAKALGWMAYPGCWHQYVDNVWVELGRATGCLTYLPQVVVEHMHFAYGKAEDDDTYRSVYDEVQAHADFTAFERWKHGGMNDDIRKVQSVL